MNDLTPRKLMNSEVEAELVDLIVKELIKKECTLSNFEEIVDKVHSYFRNNATV